MEQGIWKENECDWVIQSWQGYVAMGREVAWEEEKMGMKGGPGLREVSPRLRRWPEMRRR